MRRAMHVEPKGGGGRRRSRSMRRAVVCLGVLSACRQGEHEISQPLPIAQRRDSAGVAIVEYDLGPPAERGALQWRLAVAPEVEIGADASARLGGRARVRRVEALATGFAVGVAGTNELRIYGRAGILTSSTWRFGASGERLRGLDGPWRRGPELVVFDPVAGALRTVRPNGESSGTIPLDAVGGAGATRRVTSVVGVLADGATLAVAQTDTGSYPPGLSRPTLLLVLFNAAGKLADTLGVLSGQEVFMAPPTSGFHALGTPAFAFSALIDARGNTIVVADNSSYEIRLMNRDGNVRTILRARVPYANATDDDLRDFIAEQKEAAGARPDVTDEELDMLRTTSPHARMPQLRAVLLDEAGRVWVEEFRRPGRRSARVSVYEPDGSLRGAFELPRGLNLVGAIDDRIAVLARPLPGREVIRVYRLQSLPADTETR